jgi:lipoprotein-releasing system permease protein
MSFEYFIGGRYLRAKQKQAFVSLITILSIAGVMVGVMALIVVIAVMNGFDADLKARILGGQSHIVMMRHGGPFKELLELSSGESIPKQPAG